MYYAISICATWAGAGSFIVGTQVAKEAGILPWLLWAFGNTMTCIVFGLLSNSFPKLREVANSKPIQLLMGFMCIFQVWVNMGGVYESLSATVIGQTISYAFVYGISFAFLIFYLKNATPRNVLTDDFSWSFVYLLIFGVVLISIFQNGITGIPIGAEIGQLKAKGWTMITLTFGGFFYPTFWELLDYNDKNEDKTKKVDMRQAFIYGGLMFGFYLIFVLLGALSEYSEVTALLRGILVSLVAISSLSSFIYGTLINLGKKLGVVVNIVTIAGWQFLVPLGVMGIWTIMQNVRIWMVLGMFIIALVWNLLEKNNVKN